MPHDDLPPVRVARLSVTAIKGFALHHPEAVRLDASGAAGDRAFFLADAHDRVLSITRTGALVGVTAHHDDEAGRLTLTAPDGRSWSEDVVLGGPVEVDFFGLRAVRGRVVGGGWGALLTELVGEPVRLVRTAGPGDAWDVHPVTVLGSASVAALEARAGAPVDARRFRMLVELETDEPHVEDDWRGRELEAGDVRLRIGGPVPRCAAITRHPASGERDLPLVRTIKDHRGVLETELGPGVAFGVYAQVVRPGVLRVGDRLALVPGAPA